MRKFIISSILICSSIFIEAQNNLVFNQVLDFRVGPGVNPIVPENKVWKVEYYYGDDLRATNTDVPFGSSLNNTQLYSNINGSNAIWLSSGTILSSPNNSSVLSVLEFNVVPISESSGSSSGGGGVSADGFAASGNIINLEFTASQTGSGNIGATTQVGSITIPDGKIWKFNAYSFGMNSSPDISYGDGYSGKILVDGFILGNAADGGSQEVYLSSGTYPVYARANASGGGGTYYYIVKIGGIEYNTY